MIILGIALLILGVFFARNALWTVGAILVLSGLVLAIVNHGVLYY